MKLKKYLMLLLITLMSIIAINCGDDNSSISQNKKIYTCPMHPQVISDKPGVCPICHMDLVLKTTVDTMSQHTDMGLTVNERNQVLANVSVVKVEKYPLVKTVSAYSYLDFAEQNQKLITARFNGRIEKLYVDKTGDYIKKGMPLFEIYSPDLVQAQNDYLLALTGLPNVNPAGAKDDEASILKSSEQKLKLYGLTDEQITELGQKGKITNTIAYHSPFSGTVIEKKVQEGMYVNEGTVIYNIADLSVLWNIAEIYENDLAVVKEGNKVHLKLSSYPGETFEGRVNLIYPVVNPDTRTIKVRSTFTNVKNMLKPNMYGETIFTTNYGEGLVIPEDAVLLTGKRNIVWIKVADNTFEPREVQLGIKLDGKYQVLSGINDGDYVAATGAYLIDSESQLKSGLSSPEHQGHTGNSSSGKENLPGQQNNDQQNDQDHKKHPNPSSNIINKNNDQNNSSAEIWNKVCPVLGNKVNPKIQTVSYNGKVIGFCCPGCDKDFLEDPEKFLKNLSSDGTEFIGKNN